MKSQTRFSFISPASFLRLKFGKILFPVAVAIVATLSACGGSDFENIPSSGNTINYTIGGSVAGLQGGQVTLLLNGANAQAVSANGTFTFSAPVASGQIYAVTIGTQPAGQTCSVANGTGSAIQANVTNVIVTCAVNQFSVGGTVTGLANGETVTLLNNGGNATVVNTNGAFTFLVASGQSYAVTVGTQPAGQTCSVSNGTGSAIQANITNVMVTCAVNQFSVGGAVIGLASGEQVILLNNGGDATVVNTNGTFTFSQPVASGASYAVTVGIDPLGQTCSLTHAIGSQIAANVTDVVVSCATSTFTTLYSFQATSTDVGLPAAGLIQASDGYFYGTGYFYAAFGVGGVFKISSTGTETLLYSFAGAPSDGANPYSDLMQASNGNIYSLAYAGGANNQGAIYQITPGGAETLLYSFAGGMDGDSPLGAALVEGSDGYLYGITTGGGAHNRGTAFRIQPDGSSYSTIFSFDFVPYGLTFGADGNLYGVTAYGGANGVGMAFKLTTSGILTVLHSFGGTASDGQAPLAALTLGSDGNFYGTTVSGGINNRGVVFKLTSSGAETVIYTFGTNANDGSPYSQPLIEGSDGNLYGICYVGNGVNLGTLFVVSPTTGQEVILHTFAGGVFDGDQPVGLVLGKDGHFYGTTRVGGTASAGIFFRY